MDLVGCTETEIGALEAKYRLRVPESYRRYLAIMGHRSGRLFTSDHAAVFYSYVLNMTADLPAAWATESPPPPAFAVPDDALIIAARLGEQFEFIRCASTDDSPVWVFNSWDWQIRESHPSVLAWLESWCGEAERAIATGYFDHNPQGTTP
jgi:hypothetical protein